MIVYVMPFGKYKGKSLPAIPSDYIQYMLDNFDLSLDLKYSLNMEIQRRESMVDVSESKVKKAYREMSLKYHPDKGGSNEAMQAINDFYKILCSL